MIVPTLRFAAVLAAGLVAAAAPALVDARLWIVWLALLAAALAAGAVDALLAVPPDRLESRVDAPSMLHIGERGSARVSLTAPRWGRPIRADVLLEVDPELTESPAARATLPARGGADVDVPLVPRRRGTPLVRTLWLRWSGPAGLTRRVVRRPVDVPVKVVPNIGAVSTAALHVFGTRELLAGPKVERHLGEGSEFEQLRDFTSGFDPRSIDWRASARHTRLLCRQYRAERDQQVVMAFDTGHLMGEPLAGIPKLDHAVNAGLVLAYVALRTGDRVGVCAFDEALRAFMPPRAGVSTMSRLQDRCAALEYASAETNFTRGLTDLLGKLTRRSLVVLFTDFVDSVTAELMLDNVGRLARRHLVLFVALRDTSLDSIEREPPSSLRALHRAVAAADLVRERDVVLRRLERLGVLTIDVAPERVSARLLNRYLDVKRREMVS